MISIIITMAGLGTRFQRKGYIKPKYEILAKGKTLFRWSLISLEKFLNDKNEIIFITLKSNNSESFIESQMIYFKNINWKIVELDSVTKGQAETVMYCEKFLNPLNPILIYNIDTYVNPDYIKPSDYNFKSWIPYFKTSKQNFSFIKVNEEGKVINVKEKEKISNMASVGLYGFESFESFKLIYSEFYSKEDKKERYIAPMYNKLIAMGKEINICSIPESEVNILGTPEELKEFLKNEA